MKRGIAFLGLTAATPTLHAGSFSASSFFDTAGVRAGMGFNLGTQIENFEFFATSPTIAEWSFSPSITASLHVEGGLGFLIHQDDAAFTGRIGPLLDLSFDNSPLHLVLSTSIAYLEDQKYGGLNLGSNLEFVSCIGFDWDFSADWFLGYRFQHISNAGFGDRNPGLNLNTISLGFRF